MQTSKITANTINRIFAYGTLNLHDIQQWLWNEQKSGSVARLDDFELNVYPSGIYYIEKRFGETVAGKIYELTPEQMKRTDAYEGKAYTREIVNIEGQLVNVYVRTRNEQTE